MTVYSEFKPLEKMIVGSSYRNGSCSIKGLDRVIEETNEDLDNLQKILESLDVEVLRPEQPNFSLDIHHPIMPRDVLGVFGNKVMKVYGGTYSRIRELECYNLIVNDLRHQGYKIFQMPTPGITQSEETEFKDPHDNKVKIQERYDKYGDFTLYEAANISKVGDTLVHTLPYEDDPESGKGNYKGLNWLKDRLPEFNWVSIPKGGHIDGKVAFLRPGLLMTWRDLFIPKCFEDWEVIYLTDNNKLPEEFISQKKQRYYTDYVEKYLSEWVGYAPETWFDVNCISVNENTVIGTGSNEENIKKLEDFGIKYIQWEYRHRYFWDGGTHCVTQDVSRKDKMENYR